MAKPKAPRWLTQSFADGVVELATHERPRPAPPYKGALGRCWLAQHDERRRPCQGRLERAHLISRQRVANALSALLPYNPVNVLDPSSILDFPRATRRELIQLAEWDPRNGVVVCEAHHRRYDSHLTPALTVRRADVPERVVDFASDWGIEGQLGHFPSEI